MLERVFLFENFLPKIKNKSQKNKHLHLVLSKNTKKHYNKKIRKDKQKNEREKELKKRNEFSRSIR